MYSNQFSYLMVFQYFVKDMLMFCILRQKEAATGGGQ